MSEDTWWFHLYVMLSRATRMNDMLLLRPPPRDLLERGPPEAIAAALEMFERKIQQCTEHAERLAASLGFTLPLV